MLDFFDWLYQFFIDGLWVYVSSAIEYLTQHIMLAFFQISLWLTFQAWEAGKLLLSSYNVSAMLTSAYSALPADVSSMLGFFRIPECINILLSAGATKLVLRATPFV